MKRAIVATLLLFALVPDVVAQEEEPKVEVDPAITLMSLYDTPGRSWSYRIVSWTRGDSPYVESETVEIRKEGGSILVKSFRTDDWGNSTRSSKTVPALSARHKEMAGIDLPVESLDMGFRKFECRRLSEEDGETQTTTWVSTEFHPLVVKQTVFSGNDYEIRKLRSFNDGTTDPYQLYRKEGRSWTLEMAGGMTMRSTILSVTDEHAEMQTQMFNADGSSLAPATVTKIPFISAEGGGGDAIEMPLPIESLVSCKAGDFNCISYDDGDTWMLRDFPGVIAKSSGLELTEFDLGHDSHAFYRTVGNSYAMNTTSKLGGFTVSSTMKYEVTKIEGTTSTYTIKGLDQNGRVVSTTELTHELPEVEEGEEPQLACRYRGQVEEMVVTLAGTFPALISEAAGAETWTWNGLIIRMAMKTDDVEMIQELTELNIQ